MPHDERIRILRAKKRKVQITPPAAEEPQVPSTEADPPSGIPVEFVVSDEESKEQVKRTPKHDRKRKPNSSESRPESLGSSILWTESNENFPFQLYNSFVRDTDDHRFGNSSIMDLIDEGMKYQARANVIFGRLRPKYKEAEAEEEAARRENATFKSALAKERSNLKIALLNNECLRKDLAQTKEDLKTSSATYQVITNINVDFMKKNKILTKKIEDLAQSNSVMAKQNTDIQVKEAKHTTYHQKLEEELRELRTLRDLGPPLTDQLRKEIEANYRKSAELNNEIVHMYSEGYEVYRSKYKAKLVVAKVNPALLDSLDSEDNKEA